MRSNWSRAGIRNWRVSWLKASPAKRRNWTGPLAVSWEAFAPQPQVLDTRNRRPRFQIVDLPKDEHMKHTKLIAIVTFLLLAISGATAQSLGDYAREVRKNKAEPTSATRHFDNDNLPSGGDLSVVGPPASDTKAAPGAKTAS